MSLKFAARYCFMYNKLKYSKENELHKVFYDFVTKNSRKTEAEFFVSRPNAINSYLSLIAKKNNLKPDSKEVLEAYWIGNSLLDNVSSDDIKEMLMKFTKSGMPKSIAKSLSARVPKDATPHHSFHVMHLYTMSGETLAPIADLDKCRISWGIVTAIRDDELTVSYNPLIRKDRFMLGDAVTKKVFYDRKFSGTLQKKDVVSLHWNFAIEKLTKAQLDNLQRYTTQNIEAMNSNLY